MNDFRLVRRRSKRSQKALFLALVALLSVGMVDDAWGFHDEKRRITDRTAYTMPQESFRIGLFRADYAVFDALSVRSYIWPWVFRIPNLMMKWRPYGKDPWAIAIDTGLFYFDTKSLETIDDDVGSARVVVFPIELISTYRFDEENNLSASLLYTAVNVDGQVSGDALLGTGSGVADSAQTTLTYQYNATKVTALQFSGRLVLFQRIRGAANATFMPDEYTTVEVFGSASGEQEEVVGAASAQVDLVMSWKYTNLRLGMGFGRYTIPGVNFVTRDPTLYPSFDLYWIF